MSNQAVNIAITGNASSLVTAAKTGEKALDGLGKGAKDTGKQIDGMGEEAGQTERKVKELGKESAQTESEVKDLGRGARTTGSDVESFGQKAEKAARSTSNLGRASHSLRTTGKVLAWGSEKVINQYTALAGGAGIGLALKAQVELNDQITQMGIAARDSQTGMVQGKSFASWAESTKRTVMDVSKATGQSAEELTSGMQAIIQRTGDMGLATSSLQLMGETATASGASVAEVGALIANLGQKADIKGPEQMRQAITLLLAQGKSGAFELKDMVTNGERLFSVMSLFGKGGVGGLKSFGAFVQMARTATGSAEQASTAVERLGAFMSNVKKVEKHLASAGIHVKLDEKADMETNIKKIISATGGKFSELSLKRLSSSQAFGEEGIRAISMMANEYAAGNGFKMFDSFKEAGGDLQKNGMLMGDFSIRVQDSKLQMQRLVATLKDFADKNLSGPLAGLTKMMSFFNSNAETTDRLIRLITKGLIAMAAVAAAVKIHKTFQEFRGIFGGSRSVGGKGGLLGQVSGMDVQRVYVVNMGAAGLGGGSGMGGFEPASEFIGPQRPASAWSRWGRSAAMGTGIAALGAVMAFSEDGNTATGWGRALGGAAGVALGAFGGPIGMMIGQQIGDTVGGILGDVIDHAEADVRAETRRKMDADHKDITGKERLREFARSDATGGENLQRAASAAAKNGIGQSRFMGYQEANAADAKQAGITAEDLKKLNIVLNVETHVAGDGSTRTKVSQDASTGFFKSATDSMGSLAPAWRPRV